MVIDKQNKCFVSHLFGLEDRPFSNYYICKGNVMIFSQTKDREVDFDVETAIKVCRQAGYFEHALFLAEKHNKHEWYLRIQLEDIKQYHKALEYIGRLEFSEVQSSHSSLCNSLKIWDQLCKCISDYCLFRMILRLQTSISVTLVENLQ